MVLRRNVASKTHLLHLRIHNASIRNVAELKQRANQLKLHSGSNPLRANQREAQTLAASSIAFAATGTGLKHLQRRGRRAPLQTLQRSRRANYSCRRRHRSKHSPHRRSITYERRTNWAHGWLIATTQNFRGSVIWLLRHRLPTLERSPQS